MKTQYKKYLQSVDVLNNPNWEMFHARLQDIVVRNAIFKINHQRQRKYLFRDTVGGNGHPWQRDVFVSLIIGQPFPQFEINIDDNIIWIEDGQQRYRTFQAITSNMVKLPTNLSELGDEYVSYEGMCFDELPIDVQERILNTPILLLNGKSLSQEELHKRFLLINNGTPLSAQDKRSAQISAGSSFIQSIVDGKPDDSGKLYNISPSRKMFTLDNGEYRHVNVPTNGRNLEEIIAHWYSTLHNDDRFRMNQGQLDSLYDHFRRTGEIEHKDRFEKILDEVDKCICNYSNPKDIKGRTLTLFWFIVKHYIENGYKIDRGSLFSTYVGAVNTLKGKNEIITYTKLNGEPETLDFKRLIRICSDMAQIRETVDRILKQMSVKEKPITVDSRRTFTREEKHAKLIEQGNCCGYCGVELKLDEGVGDHMVPHSQGGETTMDNLVVSCKKCNEMKSNLPYKWWLKLLPELKDSYKTSYFEGIFD